MVTTAKSYGLFPLDAQVRELGQEINNKLIDSAVNEIVINFNIEMQLEIECTPSAP